MIDTAALRAKYDEGQPDVVIADDAMHDIPELLDLIDRLRSENTRLTNENLTLHARMREIMDATTRPFPEYYQHPRIG